MHNPLLVHNPPPPTIVAHLHPTDAQPFPIDTHTPLCLYMHTSVDTHPPVHAQPATCPPMNDMDGPHASMDAQLPYDCTTSPNLHVDARIHHSY